MRRWGGVRGCGTGGRWATGRVGERKERKKERKKDERKKDGRYAKGDTISSASYVWNAIYLFAVTYIHTSHNALPR